MYPFKHAAVFQREMQQYEMGKSFIGKCISPLFPNLLDLVTSNVFYSMITAVLSLKLCEKNVTEICISYKIFIIAVFDIVLGAEPIH